MICTTVLADGLTRCPILDKQTASQFDYATDTICQMVWERTRKDEIVKDLNGPRCICLTLQQTPVDGSIELIPSDCGSLSAPTRPKASYTDRLDSSSPSREPQFDEGAAIALRAAAENLIGRPAAFVGKSLQLVRIHGSCDGFSHAIRWQQRR